MQKPKTAEVEYIDNGTYQGGEEDASTADFSYPKKRKPLIVIRKEDFEKVWNLAKIAETHLKQMKARLK